MANQSKGSAMLKGPQRKFCEGIVAGLNGAEAYRAAYPKSSAKAAEVGASRLLRKAKLQNEIAALRAAAQEKAGSATLTHAEVLRFLARVVRARAAEEPENSDLWQSIKRTKDGTEFRLPDKLAAIARWCDLEGEGSEAEGQDALAQLLERVMK